MKKDDVIPPTEYGRLVCVRKTFKKRCHVYRIRLYDGEYHHWFQRLIDGEFLYAPTDQTYYYNCVNKYENAMWDEIWFDGVCIYKKSLFRRVLHIFK